MLAVDGAGFGRLTSDTMPDPLPLVLGSALLASLITGVISFFATRMLINDQQAARRDEADRLERVRAVDQLSVETNRFLDHFVAGGLETCAADADEAAHLVDRAYLRARRNRRLVGAAGEVETPAVSGESEWTRIGQMRQALGDFYLPERGFGQASLLPFPGDFMQSALAFNRCVSLAEDWCERYPWTREVQLERVDRFLVDLHTTLGAAARLLQAAAAVVRQMPPRRYADWFPDVVSDARLLAIAADLKALVDRQLGTAPTPDP